MKNIIYLLLASIFLFACDTIETTNTVVQQKNEYKTPICKVVKSLKEKTNQVTSNDYTIDW